eukprot:1340618-Amphidinium_carterae.2
MEKAGCTTRYMANAYDYFNGYAQRFFDTPNVQVTVQPLDQQQPPGGHRHDYSEDDDDEYDEGEQYSAVDERENSRQSGTTKTSESNNKTFVPKGRGKMRYPRHLHEGGQPSNVTNLYHTQITNFHAVSPPIPHIYTITEDMATEAGTRPTPRNVIG